MTPKEQAADSPLVAIRICVPCLNGRGDICNTPGCALFLHNSPGFPIDPMLYETIPSLPSILRIKGELYERDGGEKNTSPQISDSQAHILLHSLGLDRAKNPYRNRYIAVIETDADWDCKKLVGLKLMEFSGRSNTYNSYTVTIDGIVKAKEIKP
jgi:hypothetical protein